VDYQLSAYDAGVITQQGRSFVRYFEEVARSCGDPKEASNWTTNQVLAAMNEHKLTITNLPLSAPALGDLLRRAKDMGLNAQRTREVFARMLKTGEAAPAAIDKLGLKVVADPAQLRPMIQQAIAANAKAVADYKKGKAKAADAIKGIIMRQTKGMAKVEIVEQLLAEELEKL
jgi:aspartyl-tRNA(Asn)/glutamyl-tRNA(Gln) amidotransferase subunit B